MISFISGTYHGLFVDTGVPSILPKDISYFDFRTQRGRVVPSDGRPNLVIRYNSGGEQGDPAMMMVALSYLATEGNRQGFIAFGSLISENLEAKDIEDGIRAAITTAGKSSHIFNGKVISQRPIPREGRPLDLTGLALFDGEYYFGELNTNLDDSAAISQVSRLANELIESGIDNYEVVVSPSRGMSPDGLLDHFGYQVSRRKHEVEELRERKKRLDDRKRLDASLEAERVLDQSKRNIFLLQVFALCLVGVAIIGLVILFASKVLFTQEDIEPSQPLLKGPSETPISSTALPDVSDKERPSILTAETPSTSCGKENINSVARAKVITNLPTDGRCITISEFVTKSLGTDPFTEIIAVPNEEFEAIDWQPLGNQRLLTTFGRLVDIKPTLLDGNKSKFYDENQELVIPQDLGLNFALSMQKPTPRLFCNASIFREDRTLEDGFLFKFYTTSQFEYQSVMEVLSWGVLYRLQGVIQDFNDELVGIIDEAELAKMNTVARDIRSITHSEQIPLFDGNWDDEEDMCVVVVTAEDQQAFSSKVDNTEIDSYFMTEFVHPLVEQVKKVDPESKADKDFRIECNEIPGLFMIWLSNDSNGSPFIMRETSGFSPFTVTDGEYFDYFLTASEYISSQERYKLAEHKVFDALENYFGSGSDVSPFDAVRTPDEGFCYSVWQPRG